MTSIRKAGQANLNPKTAYDFQFGDSQTEQEVRGLDQELVRKAQAGQYFGDADRARYEQMYKDKHGKAPTTLPGDKPVQQTSGKPVPASIGDGTGGGEQGGGTVDPQQFKDNYSTSVNESFNATGGTLTNNGDIKAGGDVTLDNSVTNKNTMNNFGGDIRSFTYNAPGTNGGGGGSGGGGGASYPSMNSYKDPALNATPVSAATMAGFYQPSDSPAAAAKRTAMHSELNRGRQEKYENVGSDIAAKYIKAASQTKTIDTKALNAQLAASPEYNFAQSDLITAQTFGDIWKGNGPEWIQPDGFVKPEQPDFEDMYDNISDDITG